MKKRLSISVMGEKFEIELEEDFFEFVKEDLIKIQNPTPRELLFLILEKNKKEYTLNKKLEKLLKKIEL
ncbi:hypothetical protein FE773_07310 [Caminibacter mediatlanticus TB-2]|uniref:Uncharacterized protein n=2 Tax=Caminibacter mediatlanticus TB-2 TaxID=391592 RepID=A0ABX5VBZ0_9BACT|nr:hypothetical protein [Caminibacter mediatlanticus]QCT95002.1 hypothetical protein FE773_07310 [Caminibacter mediatlanticus TB-2]